MKYELGFGCCQSYSTHKGVGEPCLAWSARKLETPTNVNFLLISFLLI